MCVLCMYVSGGVSGLFFDAAALKIKRWEIALKHADSSIRTLLRKYN